MSAIPREEWAEDRRRWGRKILCSKKHFVRKGILVVKGLLVVRDLIPGTVLVDGIGMRTMRPYKWNEN